MKGYTKIENLKVAYDKDKDGVWLRDREKKRVAFMPRNIIIAMVGALLADAQKQEEADHG